MAKANLRLQRRLASIVAKAGIDKISLDPTRMKDIQEAITKADIRALIAEGAIKISPSQKPSRHRARAKQAQKKKGRRRGQGSKRGTAKARLPRKLAWMRTIRAQRGLLKALRTKKKITPEVFRKTYKKASGGEFRSRTHLMFYLERNNIVKKETKQ